MKDSQQEAWCRAGKSTDVLHPGRPGLCSAGWDLAQGEQPEGG